MFVRLDVHSGKCICSSQSKDEMGELREACYRAVRAMNDPEVSDSNPTLTSCWSLVALSSTIRLH